jgi:vancomycin resistance protein VanJ
LAEIQLRTRRNAIPWQLWPVFVYAIFIAVWIDLAIVFQDRFWHLAVLNTVAVYSFLPLPPLVIVAAFSADRRLLFGLLIYPMLAFLWLFGPLFVPRVQSAPAGPRLKSMTYNVLFSNEDFDAIAASIRAIGPDVVGFEELTGAHEVLPSLLASEYPYATFSHDVKINDIGLISRYPIETAEWFPLPPLNLAMRAVLDVDGRRLHVFVVHLTANNYPLSQMPARAAARYAARAGETRQLAAVLSALDGPAVLLCDCNLTDTSEAYRTLSAVLGDSFREAGWGLGHTIQPFGAPVALQRIDYVWHSREFFAASAGVGQPGGSDHHPVWAELVWPR